MIGGWMAEAAATWMECTLGICFMEKEVCRPEERKNAALLAIPLMAFTLWMNRIQMVSVVPSAGYFVYVGAVSVFLYGMRWRDAFCRAYLYLILVMVCDYFTMALLGTFFRDASYMEQVVTAGTGVRLGYLFLDKGTLWACICLLKRYERVLFSDRRAKTVVLFSFMGAVLVYGTYHFNSMQALLGWSFYILIWGSVAVCFFYYKKWEDAELYRTVTEEKVQSYARYYEELCVKQEEKEQTLHDINYHLLHLARLLKEEKKEEGIQYLGRLCGDFDSHSRLVFTGNRALDFIISLKKYEAERQGIRVTVDADTIGSRMAVRAADINVILGNLLDNAIESNLWLESGEKWLTIRVNRVNQMLFITIQNPFCQMPVLEEGIPLSGKRESGERGIGLKSVQNYVEKYEGVFDIKFQKGVCSAEAMLFL